jgi:formylglycine-generating enzyme required for sulfatase activity
MRLVRIPAGTFFMGSGTGEEGRERSELRRHVQVGEFCIATTEVTQAQYERVLGHAPVDQSSRGPNLPVHNVSWTDASEFCRVLSEREGRVYRLPREDEWEYACRAGSTGPFFSASYPEHVGWFAGNSGSRIHPVAEKWANAWGLYDMQGNVREWCDAPFGSEGDASSVTAKSRVIRGGSSVLAETHARAAARQSMMPHGHTPDLGFRVVLDVPESHRR